MSRRRRLHDREGLPPLWDPWKKQKPRESGDYLELLAAEGARVSGLLQDPANWPGLQAAAFELNQDGRERLSPGGVIDPAEYAALFRGPAPVVVQPSRDNTVQASRTSRTSSAALIALPPLDAAEARLSFRQRCIRMGRRMIAAAT